MNNEKSLFYAKNKFSGFEKITEERKKEIEEKVQIWTLQNKELDYKEKLHSLYRLLNNQDNPYKIEFNDESFLFLILAFDPELKILQISLEETNMDNVKRRFQEEFNTYYDSRLLQMEYRYNKRFPTIVEEFDQKR